METAVLSEHPVPFKTFELNFGASELHGYGLKRKLQGRPVFMPQVRRVHDIHLARFEALTPDSLPQENLV